MPSAARSSVKAFVARTKSSGPENPPRWCAAARCGSMEKNPSKPLLDVDLPDRGADGRDLQAALRESSPDPVHLLVGRVEHVDVPGTAELEEADTQLLEHIALDVQIRIDLVGEAGQRPHRRSPVRGWPRRRPAGRYHQLPDRREALGQGDSWD